MLSPYILGNLINMIPGTYSHKSYKIITHKKMNRNIKIFNSDFTNYSSQLNTPQWQQLRNKILDRDEHRCSLCNRGKSSLVKINNSTYHLGVDYSSPDISAQEIIPIRFSAEKFKSFIQTRKISIFCIDKSSNILASASDNGFLGAVDINLSDLLKRIKTDEIEFNLVKHRKGLLYYLVNLKNANLTNIRAKSIYMQDSPLLLNVHHKHYIIQHKAWEYEDDDLITLCHECHSKVHQTTGVQTYSEHNGLMKKIHLTPCSRCNGTGYFPEYNHVENGICFRCRGARFEEFIQNFPLPENNLDYDLPF